MISARRAALDAIDGVLLPVGWSQLRPHRAWERWSHRGEGDDITGQLHLQALGSFKAGMVLVSGYGCSVECRYQDVQMAVDHILLWMDR